MLNCFQEIQIWNLSFVETYDTIYGDITENQSERLWVISCIGSVNMTSDWWLTNCLFQMLYWVVLYTDESVIAIYILLIKEKMYKCLDFTFILLEPVKTWEILYLDMKSSIFSKENKELWKLLFCWKQNYYLLLFHIKNSVSFHLHILWSCELKFLPNRTAKLSPFPDF